MKKNIGFYGISEVKQICHVKMKKKKEEKEIGNWFLLPQVPIKVPTIICLLITGRIVEFI